MDRKQTIINLRNQRYTLQKIGDMFGISRERVRQIANNIKSSKRKSPTTKIPENWKPISREINGEGLDSDLSGLDRLAEIVRRRDNWMCQICNKIWEKGKRKFDVHHLDPECESVKTYENYKKFDRMITLCHKCHLGLEHIRRKTSITHIKRLKKLSTITS